MQLELINLCAKKLSIHITPHKLDLTVLQYTSCKTLVKKIQITQHH